MAFDNNDYGNTRSGYGRRSVGKWVGIYLIIAIIVYGAVYAYIHYTHTARTPRPHAQSQTVPADNSSGNPSDSRSGGDTGSGSNGTSDTNSGGGFLPY